MISIVIPTHDRPRLLQRCLKSIATQKRVDFETVIVDDGGEAPLDPLVEPFAREFPVRLIRQSQAGPAAARNRGAQAAHGSSFVFLDDDCEVAADWLERLEDYRIRERDAAIGGRSNNGSPTNPYFTAHQMILEYLHETLNRDQRAATFCASNNLCVPAEGYRTVGGFDERFRFAAGEDRDFCHRWLVSGRRLVFAPEVRVSHANDDMDFGSFWRQHFRYGRGALRFHFKRAVRDGTHVRWESPAFYGGLLSRPLRAAEDRRPLLALLVVLSQVATACGYATEVVAVKHAAKPVETGCG